MTSARAIATRCCWPPESSAGRCVQPVAQPDRGEDRRSHARSAGAGQPQRQRDVLLDGQRGEQVERLEDEADPVAPQLGQPGLRQPGQLGVADADPCRTWAGPGRPRSCSSVLLPEPGRPHHRGERAAVERHVDARERDDRLRPAPYVRVSCSTRTAVSAASPVWTDISVSLSVSLSRMSTRKTLWRGAGRRTIQRAGGPWYSRLYQTGPESSTVVTFSARCRPVAPQLRRRCPAQPGDRSVTPQWEPAGR